MQENVGRYRILRPLGRGAMGLVYLAEDPSLNRQVAIKMLDIEADSNRDREFLRGRLLRDARAAAMLSHPNIVAVYDIVEEGQSIYVVMEYIEGESLSSYLDHTAMPDPGFILRVLRQMAAGLDYTHSKGIIHRDIKPGNVMITPDGNVKILDFGIARMSDVRTSTPTGVVMGTVDYMAPEQIKAEAMDGRADQFSLAAVAYRMLTGSTLFGRHTLATLAYKLVNEAPAPVCQRNSQIPATVDPVLAKALAKSPAGRYATCRAFVEQLAQGMTGAMESPTATMVTTPADSETTVKTAAAGVVPGSGPKKRSGMVALVAGGVLVAAGAGVAIWKPWSQPTPATPHAPPTEIATAPEKSTSEPPPKVVDQPVALKTEPAKVDSQKVTKPAVHDANPPEPPTAPKAATPQPPATVAETPVTPVDPYQPNPVMDGGRPNGPQDTPFKRGLEQLRNKDYAGAIRSFTETIGRHPRMAPAHYDRALAYQFSGDLKNAIQGYTDALRFGHRDVRTYMNRAFCEVKAQQDETALSDFNQVLEMEPTHAGALNGRGSIMYRRHQFKIALRDFNAAIQSNPNLVQAYENRANTRRAVGDQSGAADDVATVRRLHQKK